MEERDQSVKEKGTPLRGGGFLPSPFRLGSHFLWQNFGERESWVCFFCDLLWVFVSHISDTMWSGRNAETCYGCVRGKIYTKLEVLSFEMARREIERVIVIDYITKFSELYSQKYLARESAKNQTLLLQGKGRVMLPNQMSLQKNSKRPSTPPSFSENYVANFLW